MPAAGLSPLRVGPEDVTASEAGELVKGVGVHHHAKGLIHAVSKQIPRELRTAMQRFEYRERSKHLDEGEVLYQAQATVDPGEDGVISRILSARVKGSKTNPFDGAVVVLYETPAGRTARCAILYNPDTFPKSVRAYDQALREGKIELPGELGDRAELREALDNARQEAARLAAEKAELEEDARLKEDAQTGDAGGGEEPPPADAPGDGPRGLAPEDIPEGVVPGETPGWPVVNDVVLDLPDEVREQLARAEVGDNDELVGKQVEEAVEAARKQAEEDAAKAVEAAREEGERAARERIEAEQPPTPEPVDLNEVELPEGNSDQIVAGMPFFSTTVVAALAERGKAQATREAATAELETRPDRPAESE